MGPGNRPLDLEWLEDFIALAQNGSFSRAAEVRNIAQPAFSRHIRALEEWVGVELFDRSAHPAALTAAGKRFLPLLEDLLASLEAARIKTCAAADQAAASLRFASTHALSLTFFPRWLGSIETRLRLGPIQTMTDHAQACEDLMGQRRVQFMLGYAHAAVPSRLDEGDYPVVRLADDVLVPVTAPDPALPGRPLYEIGRGDMLPLLEYSEASALGRIMRARFRQLFGEAPQRRGMPAVSVVFTAHNAFLLKSMASAGRGVAWLPRSLIADELTAHALVPAGDAAWQIPIEIRLYRQRAAMTPAAEALWTLVCGD